MGHDFGSMTTNHCPRITVSHPGQNWVSIVPPPPDLRAESSLVSLLPAENRCPGNRLIQTGPRWTNLSFISFFKCSNKLNQEEMKGRESWSVFSILFPPRECNGNSFLCKESEVGSECTPAQKHGHQPDPFDSGKWVCSGGVLSCPFRQWAVI